jgi:hypothetical protein
MKFEDLRETQSSNIKIRSDLQDKIMQARQLGYCRCLTGTESILQTCCVPWCDQPGYIVFRIGLLLLKGVPV